MSGPGRSVVVSGGTGALGRAVVRAFLAAGDRVVVPWLVASEREALAEAEGGAAAESRLLLVEADVADEAGATATIQAAEPVDVLVNCVGGFEGGAPILETELEVWDRMYRINVRTAVALSRAAVAAMLPRKQGAVIHVASRAAFDRPAGLAAYSASKQAVLVLTETLQKEVGATGIRVNAVVPTTIDTPANRRAMPDADFSSWTAPATIAGVIGWLSSDAAAAVRGGFIPV
jgi:NAD(P)-dependent dehydrogenase (short-subunit alcohol dehydrogenase family)